jgi:hypothetical protein
VSSPFAIGVFKTLKSFFVLPLGEKKQKIRSDQAVSTKGRYKEIRQKIGYLRVETKSRSVGIVIKKWSYQKEIRLCIA